jgi:DNA-binding response OmpR family regulator
LADAVSTYLSRAGYAVETALDGTSGIKQFHARRPDIVILDVMMPGIDGWEVCRRLRETSRTPIIMLTAKSDEADRVIGLRMGADDYVGKPFSLKELEARIEAVLRRANMPPPSGDSVVYDDGHLRLVSGSMRAELDGEPLNLTATERRLLFAMADNAGCVLSPDQILRMVWGPEYDGQTDYVKLYVWRVRQKLEPDPARPTYIKTERGLGYRFNDVGLRS